MVSVVIPTYNGKDLLEESLPVIRDALHFASQHEIIVVDNASTDGTLEFIATDHPYIRYIRLHTNTGFTGAINTGVLAAKGKLVLLINNDCLPEKGSIKKLVEFLEEHKQCVATQPVVVRPKGDIENIGFWVNTTLGKASTITSPSMYKTVKEEGRVYGLSGTCMLIKKEVFIKAGMFDLSFHSYLEDIDLALTLHELGYTVEPCLSAKVVHKHMSTSKKMGTYKQQQDIKNWWKIWWKHKKLIPFSLPFFIERLRNINGLIKKVLKLNS